MPWSSGDAKRFKRGLGRGSSEKWASIANSVLAKSGDESKAIRIANNATRAAIKRRLTKSQQIGRIS